MLALLVNTDETRTPTIVTSLRSQGFTVILVGSGLTALSLLEIRPVALIVLSDTSVDAAAALTREIRARSNASILILGSTHITSELVTNLTQGAEWRAPTEKSKGTFTRTAVPHDKQIRVAKLTLDPMNYTAFMDDRSIRLTHIEYRLLAELATSRGVPLTWRQLLRAVWQTETVTTSGQAIVKSAIYRLRSKLSAAGADADYIQTLRGTGYFMPHFPPPTDPSDSGSSPRSWD